MSSFINIKTRLSLFNKGSKAISELLEYQPISLGFRMSGLSPGIIPCFKETGQLRGEPRIVSTLHSELAERGVFIYNNIKSIVEILPGQLYIVKK